jgi:mono/diheme cytochrome c family protein
MVMLAAVLAPVLAHADRSLRFRLEVALLAHETHQAVRGRASARLLARIHSDLGVLGFEARSYCARAGCDVGPIKARIGVARKALRRKAMPAVWSEMRALRRRFPVDLRGILPLHPQGYRWREGRFLYTHLCATCHAAAGPGSPIPNLFTLAHREKPADLIVEILAGVRGTRAVGYANPLSGRQVASLADYLTAPTAMPAASRGPEGAAAGH